jgi:DNA-binding SARP family transcriptional activator
VIATCPAGHTSETDDYCSTCGTPIESASSAGASPAASETPVMDRCPNCGSPTGVAGACSECGFSPVAADVSAPWEEQSWEVVCRPDREYYDMVEPEGIDFPEDTHSRRIALVGDHVRIGRRSTSKGISPEIDLSGPLEDIGVSHRHALLMRQPDGSWALVDQGSTNGTYVNAEMDPIPPNQSVPLRDGDRVHVGAWTTLFVERVDATAARPFDVESHASKDTRNVARNRRLGMEISLLGPMRVCVGGEPASISAPKARTVLAMLALRVGAPVSAGQLEYAVWGDDEPKTADKALQGYISTLRRVLPDGAIETTPQGYRLVGPKEMVDVFRFERRCARGRALLDSGHPGAAVAEISRALDLWGGQPLPDLADGPVWASEAVGISERRASAEEDYFEGRLQLGDHQGVVADLSAAVDAEPLRERRWSQLMLALSRCGRQVDALRAFQRLRTLLGEEHGVEPSAEIVALERSIVLDGPELRWAPPAEPGGAPATGG